MQKAYGVMFQTFGGFFGMMSKILHGHLIIIIQTGCPQTLKLHFIVPLCGILEMIRTNFSADFGSNMLRHMHL